MEGHGRARRGRRRRPGRSRPGVRHRRRGCSVGVAGAVRGGGVGAPAPRPLAGKRGPSTPDAPPHRRRGGRDGLGATDVGLRGPPRLGRDARRTAPARVGVPVGCAGAQGRHRSARRGLPGRCAARVAGAREGLQGVGGACRRRPGGPQRHRRRAVAALLRTGSTWSRCPPLRSRRTTCSTRCCPRWSAWRCTPARRSLHAPTTSGAQRWLEGWIHVPVVGLGALSPARRRSG